MARVKVRRDYRFLDKDPVKDKLQTVLQDIGMFSRQKLRLVAILANRDTRNDAGAAPEIGSCPFRGFRLRYVEQHLRFYSALRVGHNNRQFTDTCPGARTTRVTKH